ncbi:MAG: bifunctional DNA primase/polymerase [Pseudonocardiaceae bacterium]
MSDPRTPEGGAGVRESVSGRLDWTHDTAGVTPVVPRIPAISPYADNLIAALAYAEAGWYVLPVRRGDYKNPGSVVGKGWQYQSSRDPRVITRWFAGTDRGIALHTGRSGAVVFDIDDPGEVPPVLGAAICRERPPFQSSRPDVPGKGHAVFAVPPGRRLGSSKGDLTGGWGEVRSGNSVIIVAPSVHEKHEQGASYDWLRTGPSPVLPPELSALLPERDSKETDAATAAEVTDFCAAHVGSSAPGIFENVALANFRAKVVNGESRHNSMVAACCDAARDARAGLYPAEGALLRLGAEFVAVMAAPRGGSDRVLDAAEAETEFDAIAAYAVGAANAEPEETVDARAARLTNRLVAPSRRQAALSPAEDADFWTALPVLTHIDRFAMSRRTSPWATLGIVLARVVAATSPHVVLPPLIGDVASLNLFIALVAVSGGGKGSAMAAARAAVDLRSGELGVNWWKQSSWPGGRRRLLLGFGSRGYGVAGC